MMIERMTGADLDEVMMIEQAAFQVPWSRQTFLTELSAPPFSCLCVARPSGQRTVAGYVCCWVIYEEVHLLNLAVHPEHRRLGIGEALLRFAMARGAAQGATKAILEVRGSNTAAHRLYERCGFRVTAFRPNYYSRPREDAVIMSSALCAAGVVTPEPSPA